MTSAYDFVDWATVDAMAAVAWAHWRLLLRDLAPWLAWLVEWLS